MPAKIIDQKRRIETTKKIPMNYHENAHLGLITEQYFILQHSSNVAKKRLNICETTSKIYCCELKRNFRKKLINKIEKLNRKIGSGTIAFRIF